MPGGATRAVTRANVDEYIKAASLRILQKASVQMEHFLSGVYFVAPKAPCQTLSWRNAEVRAMGEPTIDMNILRKYTNNESVSTSLFYSLINFQICNVSNKNLLCSL